MRTGILLIENGGIADGTFVKPMATQKKRVVRNCLEQTGKSGIAFIDTVANKSTRINYPFDKEFPRIITRVRGANAQSVESKRAKFTPLSVIAYKT